MPIIEPNPLLIEQMYSILSDGLVSDDISKPLWQPYPGPQTDALNCEADELFYGGAAGGGKSDLSIGLALTQHRKAIIFRRIYKNLRAIIDRAIEIVGNKEGLNQSDYIWRNLPEDRQLEFGAMEQEGDKENYKGNPHDLYVFDEAPDFTKSQVIFVTAWARTTLTGQRVRVVLTGNPPTSTEGEWIIERYAAWLDKNHTHPALPGELRWYAMVNGVEIECADGTPFTHEAETIAPKSRTFIPARLDDNPALRDTNYRSVLQSLPEPLRSQLLYGDFSIKANDDIWQCIPTAWVQAAQSRWLKTDKPNVKLRTIGNDVAHGGADDTTLAPLYGVWFDEVVSYPGSVTDDGAKAAKLVLDRCDDPKTPVFVDGIGVGASAYDVMRSWGMRVTSVNFGAASGFSDKSGKFAYANVRAEAYYGLREALDPLSGENICLPPGNDVLADLCAPKYKIVSGKIQLEPKADIKKRIGRSPDKGDAITLAWYGAQHSGASITFVTDAPLPVSHDDEAIEAAIMKRLWGDDADFT